jgi:aminopeptidase N
MVLHMLRRLIGNEAFFGGLRDFYREFTFRKAGTDDFRLAMERASGTSLGTFIEPWIYGSGIPRIKVARVVSATQLTVTFEHQSAVQPVPVTVTLLYADDSTDTVVVPVVERTVSRVFPLRGPLRDVKIDDDHAALATFTR